MVKHYGITLSLGLVARKIGIDMTFSLWLLSLCEQYLTDCPFVEIFFGIIR